ncbi:MAG: hypothetical protein ACO2OX_03910 [Candidatus Nanopusillus sp.]
MCHIIDKTCYYNPTAYIINTSFIYNGTIYNYEVLNNNRFNFVYNFNNPNTSNVSDNLIYVPIIVYNTQNVSTSSPFQQQIAICNGSLNITDIRIGSYDELLYIKSFSYINNVTLFNQINPNGQNVIFKDEDGNILYSWYEGQLWYEGQMSYREIACYI